VRSLHTFALFFCGFGSGSRRGGSAAICPDPSGPKYIMPVIGSRNTASAVAFSEGGPLMIVYTQKQKPACAASASATKTMKKINAEGAAAGRPWIYVGNYVSYYVDKTKAMALKNKADRKVRSLTKIAGGTSYAVTIPIEYIRELKWRGKQKLEVKLYQDRIIIRDWKP